MRVADNKPDKNFSLILIPKSGVDNILFRHLISTQNKCKNLLEANEIVEFFSNF